MSISIPRLLRRTTPLLLAIAVLLLPLLVYAQPTDNRDLARLNRRLKSLVNSFDGIRWSNVTIYRVGDEYKTRILKGLSAADEPDKLRLCAIVNGWLDEERNCAEIFDKVNNAAKRADPTRYYDRFVQFLGTSLEIPDLKDQVEETEIRDAAALATGIGQRVSGRPDNFYLVTSRGNSRPRLIAMLGVKGDEASGNIRVSGDAYVWAGGDLYEQLRLNSTDTGMYEELKSAIVDRNGQLLSNRTFVIRAYDSIPMADRTVVKASYIDEGQYDWVLTGISEGRPLRDEAKADPTAGGTEETPFDFNMGEVNDGGGSRVAGAIVPGTGEYPYELAIGTDVIASFRSYSIVNKNQPRLKWGVELRSNFDEINYPSIWGGRMTLNAILENVKIGAVLPQVRFGGNSLDSSGFGDSHQAIIGGFGAAISGDFDAPLLNKSGLFNFYGSYSFSEQFTDGLRESFFDSLGNRTLDGDVGYLIRYAAQGYYSFGFFADLRAQHLFRIKIGGGVYGVDQFRRRHDPEAPAEDSTAFIMEKDEFGTTSHGGVSGKIEYMRGGSKYPFGIGFQYFDQSVLGNVWIQFVVSQRWDLKLEGKYFTPLFRDPHAWENQNLIVPSLTVKYHFGQVTPASTMP